MTPDHQKMLDALSAILKQDNRIVGVAAGGSCATGNMDEYSDLDLVIAVEPTAYAAVSVERP